MPRTAPALQPMPLNPYALPRSWGGKRSAITAPLLAVTRAPPIPCSTRKPIIDEPSQESAQSAEPMMKTMNPASYIRTRPNMSPSRPTWVASRVMTRR